jgi:hypothetical protein
MPADVSYVLDQGDQLFGVLGAFWSLVYGDRDGVTALMRGRAEAALQSRQDAISLSNCAGIATTPLYRLVRWQAVNLAQSQRLTDTRLAYQPGSDALGPTADAMLSTKTWDYPLPANLKIAPVIVDRIMSPSVVLAQDADYHLDQTLAAIRFRDDPLSDPRFAPLVSATDKTLTVWAAQADVDAGWLDRQHAYVFGLSLGSSEAARSVTLAARAARLLGPSQAYLEQALSGVCDAPLARTTGEVVEFAGYDADRLLVVTNANVYSCGAGANSLVSAGQTLNAGDRLCDAFEVISLAHGAPSKLASLTVPVNFFQIALTGPLTWNNANTAVVVTTVGGRTMVSWALGGNPADATLFWNTVHTRGTAVGATSLAQLMDTRPKPRSGDPTAAGLPSFVNPLDWLCRNVLGYATFVVRIRPTAFGPNAPGAALMDRVLRLVLPPYQTAIVVTLP